MKTALSGLVVGVALLNIRCASSAPTSVVEATESHPFSIVAERCKSFEQVFFWTPVHDTYLVYLDGRGRGTAERVSGRGKRYHWDGTTAYYDDHNLEAPQERPEWGRRIADVWQECRSGFARTRWVEEHPREYGSDFEASPLGRWARLDLPFEWARGLLVFLHLGENGYLESIFVGTRGALKRVPIVHLNWDASIPEDKLTQHASETSVGMPPPPNPDGLMWPG